jgi:uncharacterized protein YceK
MIKLVGLMIVLLFASGCATVEHDDRSYGVNGELPVVLPVGVEF